MRKDWSGDGWEEKICEVEKIFEIEMWSDVSSIEIFLNGGEIALSTRLLPEKNFFEIEIVGLDFEKINLREIKIENFVGGF